MNLIHALPVALAAASLLIPCSDVRAELVQAHIEGIINSWPIPELNSQMWALTIVFDTSAPESPLSADRPELAEYLNTGPVKVLRLLDFSVGSSGDFTIHLVDPVPTRLPDNEFEVRISIDNFDSKTFVTRIDDSFLLPTWNGLQLDDFLLLLEDVVPGGYADGTDHLPGPDPSITIAEFSGGFSQVRLNLRTAGPLIGTPTSFALAAVPEMSPGALCAVGGLALLSLKRGRPLRTPRSSRRER
jgi:hypothetical protein